MLLLALLPTSWALLPSHTRLAGPRCASYADVQSLTPLSLQAPRARPLRCQEETMPESVKDQIPPEQLADAWRRDQKAQDLALMLKGCALYVIGCGPRRAAVGRVLARRLPNYRFYDVPTLVCNTYQAVSGGAAVESMAELCKAEPLEDVSRLHGAVLGQVQAYKRSVVTVWEGAVESSDFAVMQQGIIVNIDEQTDAAASGVSDEVLDAWRQRHNEADVSLELQRTKQIDDAVLEVVEELLSFIERNPARGEAWKAKADTKLAEQEDAEAA